MLIGKFCVENDSGIFQTEQNKEKRQLFGHWNYHDVPQAVFFIGFLHDNCLHAGLRIKHRR